MKRWPTTRDGIAVRGFPSGISRTALLAATSLFAMSWSNELAAEQNEVWSCREFSGEYEFSLALDGPYLFETVGRRWLRHSIVRDDALLIVAYDVWGSAEGEEGRTIGSIVLLSKASGDFMRYRLDLTSVYLALRGTCTPT